jgi:sulfur-oxidizing protein SoxY
MNPSRRKALQTGTLATAYALAVSAGLIPAVASAQWNDKAFEQKNLKDAAAALGGSSFTETKDVSWGTTPEIAENGAVVPVSITSNIPKTEAISFLVEKNPNSLAASFGIPAGTDPTVGTRVKMGQTSNVYALIKADGKYFVATREIKVTLGGCGG